MSVAMAFPVRRTAIFDVGRGWVLMAFIYAALTAAVIYPLLLILYQAFVRDGGMDADKLYSIITSRNLISAFKNTIILSILSVIMAGGIGVTLAWLIARTNMPFKRVFDPLNMTPFYLSSVVGALSWQVIASPRTGLLNTMLQPFFDSPPFNIYSIGGVAFVLGIYYAPFVYLFTLGSLQSMDASLEDAARISGASTLQTAFRITLPLSAPAILSAFILVFVTSLGIFGVPLVLGVPGRVHTLSTLMFRYINEYPADFATAAVIGIVLLVFTVILTILQIYLLKGRRFTTVTGKGYRPRTIDLGPWRWAGVAFNGFYLVLVLAPFVALIMVSFQDAWTGAFDWGRVTLQNYRQILFVDITAKRGFVNSMIISTVGATAAVFICLFLSLIVHRTRLPGRQGITSIALIPITVPGIVLGVGFLLAVIGTPLYGTIWIIMIAYIVNYLPTGVRNTESLVQSVSRELDESARTSGATWMQSMTKIVLPLVAPGLASIWLLMFVTFIREISSSMMLFVFGTETLSIALIRIMEYEPYGVSGAFGVLQTILLIVCVAVIRFVSTVGRKSTELAQ